MIELACIKCGSILHVPDQFAGKRGKCQKCGTANNIPDRPIVPEVIPMAHEEIVPKRASNSPPATNPSSTPRASAAQSRTRGGAEVFKRLVRLPAPVTGVKYAEISHNAMLVRWGANIISYLGWGSLFIGVISILIGIIAFLAQLCVPDFFNRLERAATLGFAWGAIDFGFWQIGAGILEIAVAAFFKMISYTCEAVRDMTIHQTSTLRPNLPQSNGSAVGAASNALVGELPRG